MAPSIFFDNKPYHFDRLYYLSFQFFSDLYRVID